MKLYCQCGYPLMVVATWNGRDYPLSLRDSSLGKDSDPITSCPACGLSIDPSRLELLPRPSVDEVQRQRWAREQRLRGVQASESDGSASAE